MWSLSHLGGIPFHRLALGLCAEELVTLLKLHNLESEHDLSGARVCEAGMAERFGAYYASMPALQ